jgi:hypothetical protein
MQPYFAFENELWAAREGADVALNRFERFLDQPAVCRGPKGSPDEHALEGSTVIWTGDRFKMWYTGRRPPFGNPWETVHTISTLYAESGDGIRWEKPDLRQIHIPCGGAPNNVLANVSPGVYGAGVMKVGGEHVMALFHLRGLKKEEPQTTFSMHRSTDGLHWKGRRKPAIREQHFEGSSSFYEFAGKYWIAGQGVWPYYHMPDGRKCGRVMVLYWSKDLKNWTRHPEPVFAYPIPKYFREASVQNHQGASVENRGRIAIGMMGQFWPGGFTECVRSTWGLIYSYDGLRWTEPFHAEPLLLPDEKSWDSGMLLQCQGLYSRGDTSYYWYRGASAAGGNGWSTTIAIGCLRMRRDGFAHVFARDKNKTATLQTIPIKFRKEDQKIYVNASASANHPLDVEMLDGRTKGLLAKATLRRSGVFQPAISLNGKRNVALKFKLRGRAKLYAFYAGPEVEPAKYLDEWRTN